MQIIDHMVEGLENKGLRQRGELIDPRFVVIHYTAGGDLNSSIEYLKNVGFGYHILIDRDGTMVQGVPFDKGVAHAGCSNYAEFKSFNELAIGVCMANYGFLDLQDPVKGHFYRSDLPDVELFDEDVYMSSHYSGGGSMAWEKYSTAQYESLFQLCQSLKAHYPSLMGIVGHDEVALGRKFDPGPAFDYTDVSSLFPNPDLLAANSRYVVDSPDGVLELRQGRSSEQPSLKTLRNGDVVYLRAKEHFFRNRSCVFGIWASVALDEDMFHSGFVAWRYLKKEVDVTDLII
ncbi:MAG: N-acetylmuramoyl-L-alanine amidase [Bacteroidia bacterium]|nr:N-acetylmuramoyl-L-alanine amidase [Bacteroidia bacterium]